MKTSKVAYQARIVARFLSSEDLRAFEARYTSACKVQRRTGVTKRDREMLRAWKKGATVSEIAQEHGVSYSIADGAINRAAREAAVITR